MFDGANRKLHVTAEIELFYRKACFVLFYSNGLETFFSLTWSSFCLLCTDSMLMTIIYVQCNEKVEKVLNISLTFFSIARS